MLSAAYWAFSLLALERYAYPCNQEPQRESGVPEAERLLFNGFLACVPAAPSNSWIIPGGLGSFSKRI